MKATRRMDDLGRIVIPKEMREAAQLKEGEAFDLTSTSNGKIIIEKAQSAPLNEETINIPKGRKMCVIRWDYNEEEIALLTKEQFDLLDWLSNRDFLNENVTWGKYEGNEVKVI